MSNYEIVNFSANPQHWLDWHESIVSNWHLSMALEQDAAFCESLGLAIPSQPGLERVRRPAPRKTEWDRAALASYREQVAPVVAPCWVRSKHDGLDWIGAHIDALDLTGETVAIFGSGSVQERSNVRNGQVPIRDWIRLQHCMLVVPDAKEYHYWSWTDNPMEAPVLVHVEPDGPFQQRLLIAENELLARREKQRGRVATPDLTA